MELNYVEEWFRYADSDLPSAEYLQGKRPLPMEIICYLCEQSAEKFLKGYLIYRGFSDVPKTHNLILLNSQCKSFDSCFCEIEKACGVLTRYGVQPRYPNEMEIVERDMTKALEYARQIRNFAPLSQVRQEICENDGGGLCF